MVGMSPYTVATQRYVWGAKYSIGQIINLYECLRKYKVVHTKVFINGIFDYCHINILKSIAAVFYVLTLVFIKYRKSLRRQGFSVR